MNAFMIIFGWNRGDKLPTDPGYYYVARIDSRGDIDISTFNFTPEFGWNTLLTKNPEHEIKLENYFWHPMIRIGGAE